MVQRPAGDRPFNRTLSRRNFIRGAVALGAVAPGILAACGGSSSSTPASSGSSSGSGSSSVASTATTASGSSGASGSAATKAPTASGSSASPASGAGSSAAKGTPGGTLTIGQAGDPKTMNEIIDPGVPGIGILNQTQDGLLNRDRVYNETIPGIATALPETPDELTYIFTLRDDIQFHSGDKVTADDVVYTYQRILNPDFKATFGQPYRDNIASVEAKDAKTVVFKMKQPWPIFLSFVSGNHPKIIQKKIVEDPNYGNSVWSGTGPFKVTEWVKGDHITIVKSNTKSPQGTAYLDKIVYRVIPEAATRISALETGQIDVVYNVDFKDVKRFEGRKEFMVGKSVGSGTTLIIYNTAIKPFDKKEVRKAISLGIDRKALVDSFFYGYADVAGDLFPPNHWAHDKSIVEPYDPKAAKDMLEAAGYNSSNPLKFGLLVNSTEPIFTDQAVMIQAQLKQIGVQMEIQPIEYTAQSALMKEPPEKWPAPASMLRITPLRGTAFEFGYYQYGATGALNYSNFNKKGGYQRPDIEEKLKELDKLSDFNEQDRAKAKPMWVELCKMMNDDPVQLRLNFWNTVDIYAAKVQDFVAANADINTMAPVWLKQ